MPLDDEHQAIIRDLLEQNRKIEAIKIYREQTGVGLAEAKQAVESIELGQPLPGHPQPGTLDAVTQEQIRTLIKHGQKIEAIKLYREVTGVGLKEAKDRVEALIEKPTAAAPRPGTIDEPRGAGCLGMLLLVTVAIGWLLVQRAFD